MCEVSNKVDALVSKDGSVSSVVITGTPAESTVIDKVVLPTGAQVSTVTTEVFEENIRRAAQQLYVSQGAGMTTTASANIDPTPQKKHNCCGKCHQTSVPDKEAAIGILTDIRGSFIQGD